MPKGRMLNKRISKDHEVAKLSCKTALLYSWCIPHLDVEGRIEASPDIIKGVVMPYRNDFTLAVINKCIEELSKSDGLIIYYGNTHKYMQFLGFAKNQKVNKDREAPSEIPAPTPDELRSLSCLSLSISKDKFNTSGTNEQPIPPLIETFFSYFTLKTKKAFRLTEANRDLIKKRLDEGYTLEQLKKAVDNFMLDDWPERQNRLDLIYCIGKQRGKPDSLEKWLNFIPKPQVRQP